MRDEKVIAMQKIDNANFEMKVYVINFGAPVYKRKYRYLPTTIEVDYTPLKEGKRLSFSIRGWSEDCFKKRMHLGGYATGTTSFPLKKRFVIKVPCDLVHEVQKIIFLVEIYSNLITHKGIKREFTIRHKIED